MLNLSEAKQRHISISVEGNSMKKFVCVFLILAMLFSTMPLAWAAKATEEKEEILSVDEILDKYQDASMQHKQENILRSDVAKTTNQSQLKQQTINELKSYGYSAYDVNPETYASVEKELRTDFSTIDLDPSGSYLVVVSGEDPAIRLPSRESAGNSFVYTAENGRSYTMRYLTITADDNSNLSQFTRVDILDSSSSSAIQNCLNTAIEIFISYASETLGTIAAICGLSLDDFVPSRNAVFEYTAGSNWTQMHTQVLDEYDYDWMFGSCVTKVYSKSWVYYTYYDKDINAYTNGISNQKTATLYSPNYWDLTWRREQAIIGSQIALRYDATGDVRYKYGGSILITHTERSM